MIRLSAALGVLWLAGCTSVKLVQRENCWVRKTERWPGRITEELGPCAAPAPPWSEDRVTRAIQECVARADHRWQTQAQLAWSRGDPLPVPSDEAIRTCLDEPAKALAGDNELLRRKNEDMKERLAELGRERDALRSHADEERARREASVGERLAAQERMTDRLLTTQEKVGERVLQGQEALATYLGEAAQKSSQPAVANATATSNSDSDSDSDGTAKTESASTTPVVAAQPAARTMPAAARSRARAPVCPAPREGAAVRNAAPALPAAGGGCEPRAQAAPVAAPALGDAAAVPQPEWAAAPPTPEAKPAADTTKSGTGAGVDARPASP